MESISEYTDRVHTMAIYELKTEARDWGRIIASDPLDVDHYLCQDAVRAELRDRRCAA